MTKKEIPYKEQCEEIKEFMKDAFVADSAELVFAKVIIDGAFVKLNCSDGRGVVYVAMMSEDMFKKGSK
jgi:hypothetical protein